MLTFVGGGKIRVHHQKISLIDLHNYHNITYWTHLSPRQIWSKHWLPSRMVANQIDPTMCEHHKGGQDSTSLEQLKHCHL